MRGFLLVSLFAGVVRGAAHVLVLKAGGGRRIAVMRRHSVNAVAQEVPYRVVAIDFQPQRRSTGRLQRRVAEVLGET